MLTAAQHAAMEGTAPFPLMTGHEPLCVGTKVCKGCGAEKPVLMFAASRSNVDGLTNRCRQCTNALQHATRVRLSGESTVRKGWDEHYGMGLPSRGWPDGC